MIADDTVICSESGEEEEKLERWRFALLISLSPLQLISPSLASVSLPLFPFSPLLSVCLCMDSSQVPTSGLTHLR